MGQDHRKLEAFQLADDLVLNVYRVTRRFPTEEKYGLVSQLRRAAVSVPTNIVEGCARATSADLRHFLTIAHGSLREVGYLLDLAARLEFLNDTEATDINERYDHASRVLNNLIRRIEK